MREVDRRDLQFLPLDVLPDIQLGPVGQRERANVFAAGQFAVVEIPQLRTLIGRVPLPERVAEGEDPLLRPRLLLVPPRAPEQRVEVVLKHGVEQRDGLQPIARRSRPHLLDDSALIDRVLHRGDNQFDIKLCDTAVAKVNRLREVVARIDMHHRERNPRRPESLLGQTQHHDRVLAAGEQQAGPLELGGDLADDVNALSLEPGQRVQ